MKTKNTLSFRNSTIYIRSQHSDVNYYTKISNKLISDERLSLIEIGLMVKILSNSNDYIINTTYLQKISGIGEDKFYKSISKLIECGYLHKKRVQSGIIWTIFEEPTPSQVSNFITRENTSSENTSSENTSSENTSRENGGIIINNEIINNEIINNEIINNEIINNEIINNYIGPNNTGENIEYSIIEKNNINNINNIEENNINNIGENNINNIEENNINNTGENIEELIEIDNSTLNEVKFDDKIINKKEEPLFFENNINSTLNEVNKIDNYFTEHINDNNIIDIISKLLEKYNITSNQIMKNNNLKNRMNLFLIAEKRFENVII